jgi:hypothetical protein
VRSVRDSFALRAISCASVSLPWPGFIDEGTAGNARGQLAGSGVWVQVAEIFKSGQKTQNPYALGKKACSAGQREEKKGVECTGALRQRCLGRCTMLGWSGKKVPNPHALVVAGHGVHAAEKVREYLWLYGGWPTRFLTAVWKAFESGCRTRRSQVRERSLLRHHRGPFCPNRCQVLPFLAQRLSLTCSEHSHPARIRVP